METYKAQEAPETHNMHKDPFQSCKSSKLEGVLEELQEIVADNPRYCTSHLSPHAGESFGGVAVFQVTQTNPHPPASHATSILSFIGGDRCSPYATAHSR